jgi:hypothetical protein
MKKILTIAILAVAFCFGQANAQLGPICIELVGFCDQLEMYTDTEGNTYGLWDWDCTGTNLAPVLGRFGGEFNAGGAPAGLGNATNFVFTLATRTFDLWGSDGFSTLQYQDDAPWAYAFGPCVWAPEMGNYENSLSYYLENHQ